MRLDAALKLPLSLSNPRHSEGCFVFGNRLPKEKYRIELLGVTLARFSRPFAPMSAFFQTEGVEVESTEVLPSTL